MSLSRVEAGFSVAVTAMIDRAIAPPFAVGSAAAAIRAQG
jgi:hypothetical protein